MRPATFLHRLASRCRIGASAGLRGARQHRRFDRQVRATDVGRGRWRAALRRPVSTGRPGYDTPNGTFKPNRMDADHLSQEWDNAPMPHSIFFDLHGHAIHGFFDVKHLGLAGVAWLRAAVAGPCRDAVRTGEGRGMGSTTVIVGGQTPGGRRPAVARQSAAATEDRWRRDPRNRATYRSSRRRRIMASPPTTSAITAQPATVSPIPSRATVSRYCGQPVYRHTEHTPRRRRIERGKVDITLLACAVKCDQIVPHPLFNNRHLY